MIIGGDINSWPTQAGRQPCPAQLPDRQGLHGRCDGHPARIDVRVPDDQPLRTRVEAAQAAGSASASTSVMVQGRPGFSRYENVMKVVDTSRPSDHNMVAADIVL